ncbi:hypothetical protein VTI74DRAFT_8827 [Chaetomium olivicolor]
MGAHDTPRNAPIEKLPPEIRRYLLFSLDFDELRTLVKASPAYYQQYELDRRPILCKYVERTLGYVTVEACANHQADTVRSLSRRHGEFHEAMDRFRVISEARSSPETYSILADDFDANDIGEIITFHRKIVVPIARVFADWALANLSGKSKFDRVHEPVTRTEQLRIFRAFYRFQLCCHLWGKIGCEFMSDAWDRCASLNLDGFCGPLEHWEIEEIGCVYKFVKAMFDKVFTDIHQDVRLGNDRFEPDTEGSYDFDNAGTRQDMLTGTISRGLKLLHRVMYETNDHHDLVIEMLDSIRSAEDFDFEKEMLEFVLSLRRNAESSGRLDQKQKRRGPLPFRGDGAPDTEGDRPPLAWTLIRKGTYSNSYHGLSIPEDLRYWGYVMWDSERLNNTPGALELLET